MARLPVGKAGVSMHRALTTVGAALVLGCVAACGGSSAGPVAAQVGVVSLSEADLNHWASVATVAHGAVDAPKQPPKLQALSYLITSHWLIGEAAEEGMVVSSREVSEQLQARIASYSNGRAEFNEVVKSRGETLADVNFEIELELASDKIHRMLTAKEHAITPALALAYYDAHKAAFVAPEERKLVVWSSESLSTARKVKREVEHGRSLSHVEERKLLQYVRHPPRNALEVAIFSAPTGPVMGPVTVGPNHFVFEVKFTVSPRQKTFAQVRGKIESQLAAEQRQRVLLAFATEWERRWRSRTSCSAGYVVPKCSQYTAKTSGPEIPASLE